MSEERTILSNEESDRRAYKEALLKTLDAILASFGDESAFSGIDPYALREKISSLETLPEEGKGFDDTLQSVREDVMPNLLRTWSTSYMPHLHSPALIESLSAEMIISTFNDSMDTWDQSPAATEMEVHVMDTLKSLFGFPSCGDGTFTSGGSVSNLFAITCARDWFIGRNFSHDAKKHGLPDEFRRLRMYTSEISHFSFERACHMLGLGYDAVRHIPVDDRCKANVAEFKKMVAKDKANGYVPFAAVATIGTTDFGSIDDISGMREVCDEHGMWLHGDAAYGSGAVMSKKYKPRIGDTSLLDSITVDFHKMFLLPISCSTLLVSRKEDLNCFLLHADYLNREEDEEDGYINLVGKGIQTTRRFDALKVFMAFRTRGMDGYGRIIDRDIENAEYFFSCLKDDNAFETAVKPELSSVVFRLRESDEVNKKVRRKLLQKGIVIGQTVKDGKTMLKFTILNPKLTEDRILELIGIIKETAKEVKGERG